MKMEEIYPDKKKEEDKELTLLDLLVEILKGRQQKDKVKLLDAGA